MPVGQSNAAQVLCSEILASAAQKKEQILAQAQAEAHALVVAAEQEASRIHREKQVVSESEAKRRSEAILATVAVEIARLRLAHAEDQLGKIREGARDRLRKRLGYDFGTVMAHLAADALGRMNGVDFAMRLAPADEHMIGNGMANEIQRQINKASLHLEVIADPALKEGNVLLEDMERRQLWDISLEARLERLWPEVRQQIAVQAGLMADKT